MVSEPDQPIEGTPSSASWRATWRRGRSRCCSCQVTVSESANLLGCSKIVNGRGPGSIGRYRQSDRTTPASSTSSGGPIEAIVGAGSLTVLYSWSRHTGHRSRRKCLDQGSNCPEMAVGTPGSGLGSLRSCATRSNGWTARCGRRTGPVEDCRTRSSNVPTAQPGRCPTLGGQFPGCRILGGHAPGPWTKRCSTRQRSKRRGHTDRAYRPPGRDPSTPWSSAPGRTGSSRRSPWPPPGGSSLCRGADRAGGGTRSAELTAPACPRRLLGDPPARCRLAGVPESRCRALGSTAWSGSTPTCRSRTRSTAAAPRCCTARSTTPPPGSAPTRAAYRRLFGPLVVAGFELTDGLLSPLTFPPKHPFALARFGAARHRPGGPVARRRFRRDDARGLFAGLAGHSILSLGAPTTAGYGLMLGVLGHLVGWPMASGGSQADRRRARRPARVPRRHGRVRAPRVDSLAELPPAGPCCSTSRRARCSRWPATASPARYRRPLDRSATGPACSRSTGRSTGRSRGRTPAAPGRRPSTSAARSPRWPRPRTTCSAGRHPERPFVLLAQQSLFDPTRAPAGQAHGLGVLPRAQRLDGRHDRPDRGPGRAVRPRLPRPHPRPAHDERRRRWSPRRQLHRRRHQRRRRRPPPVRRPPDARPAPVADPGRRRCTCARRRRRPAAASTACAACTPPARSFRNTPRLPADPLYLGLSPPLPGPRRGDGRRSRRLVHPRPDVPKGDTTMDNDNEMQAVIDPEEVPRSRTGREA